MARCSTSPPQREVVATFSATGRISSPNDLINLYVSSNDGELLPLSSVVQIREDNVAAELERHEAVVKHADQLLKRFPESEEAGSSQRAPSNKNVISALRSAIDDVSPTSGTPSIPRGSTNETVILDASLEVRGAIVYATIIEIVAVVPILLLQGLSGSFFQPLALAYALALLASMVVALTVTPALCSFLLPNATAVRVSSTVKSVLFCDPSSVQLYGSRSGASFAEVRR
mgnify:CR=1 FL=1